MLNLTFNFLTVWAINDQNAYIIYMELVLIDKKVYNMEHCKS